MCAADQCRNSDLVVVSPSLLALKETAVYFIGVVTRTLQNMVSILTPRQKLVFGDVCAFDNRRNAVSLGFAL
jgi:hypothetical protein